MASSLIALFHRAAATALALAFCLGLPPAAAQSQPPLRLRVVGSLANLNQYVRHEEPFWTRELPRLSGGQLSADIVPFDRAGVRGQEILRLVQLGAVPFGTVLLSLSAAEEPELGAPDLAGQNADIGALGQTVSAFRPYLEKMLRERYGVELLGLYTYPAQVVFCNKPFTALSDLAGRRIRTSSPTQSDLVEALSGVPVRTSFAEIVPNIKTGNVECAITGAMSGHALGLHQVTTHVHTMAVNWGLSALVANAQHWKSLPGSAQSLLKQELPKLEQAIWADAERETLAGVACLTGQASCPEGQRGRMVEVRPAPSDEKRRKELFSSVVLPRWVQRCGAECARMWNGTLAPTAGVEVGTPKR